MSFSAFRCLANWGLTRRPQSGILPVLTQYDMLPQTCAGITQVIAVEFDLCIGFLEDGGIGSDHAIVGQKGWNHRNEVTPVRVTITTPEEMVQRTKAGVGLVGVTMHRLASLAPGSNIKIPILQSQHPHNYRHLGESSLRGEWRYRC
jgi:hypothetical protein